MPGAVTDRQLDALRKALWRNGAQIDIILMRAALDEFAHLRRQHVELVLSAERVDEASDAEVRSEIDMRVLRDRVDALRSAVAATIPGKILAPVRA